MKQWRFVLITVMCSALILVVPSCKKDEGGSTGPDNNPATSLYGSGSVSFNSNSSVVGNYSISGSFNGSSGSGIWCWHQASSGTAVIYGFVSRSSSDWDWAMIAVTKSPGDITTGSYGFSGQDAALTIVKGASSMGALDGSQFVIDSGTLNVTSVSSTGMAGNFSGTGIGVSQDVVGTQIQVTNGSFNVTFGTAGMP